MRRDAGAFRLRWNAKLCVRVKRRDLRGFQVGCGPAGPDIYCCHILRVFTFLSAVDSREAHRTNRLTLSRLALLYHQESIYDRVGFESAFAATHWAWLCLFCTWSVYLECCVALTKPCSPWFLLFSAYLATFLSAIANFVRATFATNDYHCRKWWPSLSLDVARIVWLNTLHGKLPLEGANSNWTRLQSWWPMP